MVLLHIADLRATVQAVELATAGINCSSMPWGGARRDWAPATQGGAYRGIGMTVSRAAASNGPLLPSLADVEAIEERRKPSVCTADELHYVAVPGTEWSLALWRYLPSSQAPLKNHPLMLLSGVGTNAIGFDLSPGASFARHMSCQGFDTWIVEVRGAGLSLRKSFSNQSKHSINKTMLSDAVYSSTTETNGGLLNIEETTPNPVTASNGEVSKGNGIKRDLSRWDESELVTKLANLLLRMGETLSGYLNEGQLSTISANFLDRISKLLDDAQLSERFDEIKGRISSLLEAQQNYAVAGQIRDLSQRLVSIIEEGQRTVSPQLFDIQERFSTTIEDFQRQLDLIVIYDWDFDNYLEEDIPAAMKYIQLQSNPKDGKLLAIGHSMGGILLYAMLSRSAFQGIAQELAAVVTLASSVDYTSSNSSLKLLLPLADPAQALNVPVVPLGAILAAAYPLASNPPYVLSWLLPQISAQDMMRPDLFEKLVLKNFCTVPAKVILQLTTAFRVGGLCNRTGDFSYKNHLDKCNTPVLALAGDQDLICPPEAVYETVKVIPRDMVTYKVLGKLDGPHYAHYDLVGGRLAAEEVYPCIVQFLSLHDNLSSSD